MSCKQPRRSERGEIRDLFVNIELEFQERDKIMGIVCKQWVSVHVRITCPVLYCEQDCLQPGGAGFRGSNEEDIGVLSLKVLLTCNYSLQLPR